MRAVLICALLATTTAIAIGCDGSKSAQRESAVTELTEPASAITEELMVALAQAKNFHHKADVHLKDAQLDLAIESVSQILSIPFPEAAPEARDVILDARARLAKLFVTKGQLAEAMKVADAGIAVDERRSFFLANLFTVRGHVWEARALRADEAGDIDGGKQARRKALADFDQAISINRAVLREISGQPANGERAP